AFRPRTTLPGQGAAPNLIKELQPNAPDQVWASDITYVSTLEGWLYLAVILDLFSRRAGGWKLGERQNWLFRRSGMPWFCASPMRACTFTPIEAASTVAKPYANR